jgi:hypothetical protein
MPGRRTFCFIGRENLLARRGANEQKVKRVNLVPRLPQGPEENGHAQGHWPDREAPRKSVVAVTADEQDTHGSFGKG